MRCVNRLTVVGGMSKLQQFRRSDWEHKLRARFVDLLEQSFDRIAWQFKTREPPIKEMESLSRSNPTLTFLLDYEIETHRMKGLVKIKAGVMESCVISY